MANGGKRVPVQIRLAGWLTSAAIGLALYVIFNKVFLLVAGPDVPMDAIIKLNFWAMVIGVVAGTGSFALIFANWAIGAGREAAPAAASQPDVQGTSAQAPQVDEEARTEELPREKPAEDTASGEAPQDKPAEDTASGEAPQDKPAEDTASADAPQDKPAEDTGDADKAE